MTSSVDANARLRHLAHELRQPLSGIESIAYYLEMALDGENPQIVEQCDLLRQMVRHANWLLEDAALALKVGGECEPGSLGAALKRLGAALALDDERDLELRIEPGLPDVCVPAGLLDAFCAHLVGFFYEVAQAADPLVATVRREGAAMRMIIDAEVEGDACEAMRLIDAPQPGSGITRFLDACGGEAVYTAGESRLRASLRLAAINP